MKKIIIACTVMLMSQCSLIYTKKTESLTMQNLKDIEQFHTKFMEWERTLSTQQKNFFHDLFQHYQNAYQDRKKAKNFDLLQEFEKSLQHIMDTWQSFYKNYSNAMIFHQQVQEWYNALPKHQRQKIAPLWNDYNSIFQEYDKDPSNPAHTKQLHAYMDNIQNYMTM